MRHNKTFRRILGLICSSVILMLAGALTTAMSASANNNNNNNGTVDVTNVIGKVGNEPKVACPFDVTFSGFDAGQLVTATISDQSPHGVGQIWTGSKTLDNSGAGSVVISGLDFSGMTANPTNGYHLTLGVLGQEQKSKTFWAQCDTVINNPTTTTTTSTTVAPTTTTVAPTTTTVDKGNNGGGTTTTVDTPTTAAGDPVVSGVQVVTSDNQPAQVAASQHAAAPAAAAPAAAPAAQVLGTQITRTELAHTGPQTKNLLIIATWLFALGGALVTFSKVGRVPAEG